MFCYMCYDFCSKTKKSLKSFDCGQWSDKKAYKDTLLHLGGLFKNNFEVFLNYKVGKDSNLTEEILAAGPTF